MPWTSNVVIPDQLSKGAPALAEFVGGLHLVHPGDSSNKIWWSTTTDGDTWTANQELPGQLSKGASALAAFGGRLHIVHQGDTSNDLWHSSFDGTRWTTNVRIPGESAQSPPALAAFGGLLHCLHNGGGSHALYHLTFDGNRWTKRANDPALARQLSKGAPALAEFGGLLHMVHQGDSSNQLWHATFDGTSWSDNQPIPGQLSKSPGALAAFGGLLHLMHLGDSSNHLWHSTFDGSTWQPNISVPYQLSKAAPALAGFGNRLHMVHLGDTSNRLWHSTSDGVLVRRPQRRVVILDLDGLRWDTFAAHLKHVRDAGASLSSTYRFELPEGASDDTVLGRGGQQLHSAFAELCLGSGNGMVDVRFAVTGYPSYTFPMHGTMFTGSWPGRHGVTGNTFLVRDAPPEWDYHDWEALPRALSLAGFCTTESGEFGAFLDYLWDGFDQVSEGSCKNRNRGLNSDLRLPTVFERVEQAGLRSCAIHAFYHGATRPWDDEGKDQWWHYDSGELRSIKDVCSDEDVDQLERADHGMFTKASLLTRFRPSTVTVIGDGRPGLPSYTADTLNGAPNGRWRVGGEQHPDGIPDLICLYAASIDYASHSEGLRNQETYLSWFDHRLARFAADLRAAEPDLWDRTIFALVADHGHTSIASAPATDNLRGNEWVVREELLRIRDGAAAEDAIEDLRGLPEYVNPGALLKSVLADDFRAYNQGTNLFVYVRDRLAHDPNEVARRLLSKVMRTQPFGALVLTEGRYRFLERGAARSVPISDPAARAAFVAQSEPPSLIQGEIEAVSLDAPDASAERTLRGRLNSPDAFELLQIERRVAGLQPDGHQSMPDVILLAPGGRAFSETPSTHGALGYPTSRIPMVFFGPGMPDGRRTLDTASLVDFTPTILGLLGLGVPDDLAGRALLGVDGGFTPAPRVAATPRNRTRLPIRPVPIPETAGTRPVVKARPVGEEPGSGSDRRRRRGLLQVGIIEVDGRPQLDPGVPLRAVTGDRREFRVRPVRLQLPRTPRWLADVLALAATQPGIQLDLSAAPGLTLTEEEFGRLVGGLQRVLSTRRLTGDLPEHDLQPVEPGRPGRLGPGRVFPGRVEPILVPDPPLLAPPASAPLGSGRRLPGEGPFGRLAPGMIEPVPGDPGSDVDQALAVLAGLLNRTHLAALVVPGRG